MKLFEISVPASTVFAILKRAKLVGKKIAEKLTKKHLKRYRRPLPGYLQMDFKYVPYKIENKQYYQISAVDHHLSWRLIRCYKNKNIENVLLFLAELKDKCPFPVIEIQTDNDMVRLPWFLSLSDLESFRNQGPSAKFLCATSSNSTAYAFAILRDGTLSFIGSTAAGGRPFS